MTEREFEPMTLFGFLTNPTTMEFYRVYIAIYIVGEGLHNHLVYHTGDEIDSRFFEYLEYPISDYEILNPYQVRIDVLIDQSDDYADDDFDPDLIDIPPLIGAA